MRAQRRHEEIAERIITHEGLAFALAAGDGKTDDLRKARADLKAAICTALVAEWVHVTEWALAGDL